MKLVLALLLAALSTPTSVSITISAHVLQGGGSTAITCRVHPDPRNRELRAGIPDVAQSSRQLEGEDAPITHRFAPITHIPCDADTAYCQVIRNDGSYATAKTTFLVSCQ